MNSSFNIRQLVERKCQYYTHYHTYNLMEEKYLRQTKTPSTRIHKYQRKHVYKH